MKRLVSFLAAGSCTLLLANTPLRADGFNYSEHGACASGLAGAFIARACNNDPSSLFYNPASAVLVAGTRVTIGGTMILNRSDYEFVSPLAGPTMVSDRNETFVPVHAFVTHQVNPNLTVGLAFFIPYGLGTEWETQQPNVGRFVGYNTEVLAYYTQPTIAYRLSPQIAIGGGLEIAYTTAELNRLVDLRDIPGTESLDPTTYPPLTYSAADADLSANAWSLGFVASVLIEPSDQISIGMRYMSETKVELDGDLTLAQTPLQDQTTPAGDSVPNAGVIDAIVAAGLSTQPVPGRAELTLPDQINIGIEVRTLPRWTFALGYLWTNWSDFDEVVIDVQGQAPDVLTPRYDDGSMFRLGAAYEATERLTLRGGYIHDPTPADAQNPFGVGVFLPDATRNDFSLGVGWQLTEKVRADAYWLGVFFQETEGCVVPQSASACAVPAQAFSTTAHLLGATLNFAL